MIQGVGGSDGSASEYESREVRYTDHEYEDDSSDCEDVVIEVPSLPGRHIIFSFLCTIFYNLMKKSE